MRKLLISFIKMICYSIKMFDIPGSYVALWIYERETIGVLFLTLQGKKSACVQLCPQILGKRPSLSQADYITAWKKLFLRLSVQFCFPRINIFMSYVIWNICTIASFIVKHQRCCHPQTVGVVCNHSSWSWPLEIYTASEECRPCFRM